MQSPFTLGIIQNIAETARLIPAYWQALARTVLAPGEVLQFETWWADYAETLAAHNRANNVAVSVDQLLGMSNWLRVADQLPMQDLSIEQVRRCCLRAWEKIEPKGQSATAFQKIHQGPKEPYTEFIARLQESIKKQVTNAEAADTILQLLAYENANEDCKKAIRPFKGKASLTKYIKMCQGVGTESFKANMMAQATAGLKLGKIFKVSVTIVKKLAIRKRSVEAVNKKLPR